MVSFWIVGLAFIVLIVIQAFWAFDLLLAEVRGWRGWGALARSGSFWLACFNVATGLLHAYFVSITFGAPFRQTSAAVAGVVLAMALTAALTWWFLPREVSDV